MENKIPQKSFDAQMHIIRDVHFDVDKYKVGELYVINLKDPAYLSVQNKTIAQLTEVKEHELKFKTLALNYDPETGNSYNTYSIGGLRYTIDDIIERRIEIERLMTETEAVVYLTSIIPKVCAEELIPKPIDEEPVLAGKYKGDLSHFIIPNSLACGEKQSTLDPKDPKFNRLLGIVPDHSQFPYTLERTHSYQELQAAYKINTPEEAAEIAKNSQMNIVDDFMESAVDTNIDRLNYTCRTPGTKPGVALLFFKEDGSFAYEFFDRFKESIKVTLKSGETTISFRTSSKNITADRDTISMRNGNGTIKMVLHKDSFYKIFDEICFEG